MNEGSKKASMTEAEELEMLNREANKMSQQIAKQIYEKESRRRSERRFQSAVNLVTTAVMWGTMATSLAVLGCLVESYGWLLWTASAVLALAGAFRCGFIWNDLKNL